jgi:hypothetical protein
MENTEQYRRGKKHRGKHGPRGDGEGRSSASKAVEDDGPKNLSA